MKKSKRHAMTMLGSSFVVFLLSFGFGQHVRAATFSAVPDSSQVNIGDHVVVDIMIDNEHETINAIAGRITFPSDVLEVFSISRKDSVLDLWIKEPAAEEIGWIIKKGSIEWGGAIPGGFDGVRSAFYTDTRPGKLFQVTFIARKPGTVHLSFQDLDVRLHDGLATRTVVSGNPITVLVTDHDAAGIKYSTASSGREWGILMVLILCSVLSLPFILKLLKR